MSWLIFVLLWCSVFALVGSTVGAFSGLLPGLHPNTLAAMTLGCADIFIMVADSVVSSSLPGADAAPMLVACFLIGLLLSHSMTELIPTAMMGVANEDTVIALLPSQRLYEMGRSDLLIESVILGGLGAVIAFSILVFPVRLIMGSPIELYSGMRSMMAPILIAICAICIVGTRGTHSLARILAVFFVSGSLGILILSLGLPCTLTSALFGDSWVTDPSSFFLAVFSGFFAMPSLLLSRRERRRSRSSVKYSAAPIPVNRPLIRSLIPSSLVGWIPGITNAYATSLSMLGSRRSSDTLDAACKYVMIYAATNVGGSLQSILAMATINRSRNGILEAISGLFPVEHLAWADLSEPPMTMIAFLWAACVASVIGALFCRYMGRKILESSRSGGSRAIRIAVAMFITILVFWLSGPVGLLIQLSCFVVGLWTISMSVPRIHLMGYLLVPVIIYFSFE